MYLICEHELDEFEKGKLKKSDLTKVENLALFYYCGEHVKRLLEDKKLKVNRNELIKYIENVKKELSDGKCLHCIVNALEDGGVRE